MELIVGGAAVVYGLYDRFSWLTGTGSYIPGRESTSMAYHAASSILSYAVPESLRSAALLVASVLTSFIPEHVMQSCRHIIIGVRQVFRYFAPSLAATAAEGQVSTSMHWLALQMISDLPLLQPVKYLMTIATFAMPGSWLQMTEPLVLLLSNIVPKYYEDPSFQTEERYIPDLDNVDLDFDEATASESNFSRISDLMTDHLKLYSDQIALLVNHVRNEAGEELHIT